MNVLSLFDGMSCGQIALERVGIDVDAYYAAEIDKYAIQIAKKNYPDTIHLGDVQDVHGSELPKIDLLIGGSPCQGFSFAGKNLNFADQRSKLFFEYVRLLKECKPTYFMLENVMMKKESEEIITKMLGVEPIKINSHCFSAQNRNRLYWTNIPVDMNIDVSQDLLKHILEQHPKNFVIMSESFVKRNWDHCLIDYNKPKAACLSATEYVKNGRQGDYLRCDFFGTPKLDGELHRKLTPIECERLQTVPDNYTEGVSNTQRYKMLGNGWTVDVIAHIFKGMLQD